MTMFESHRSRTFEDVAVNLGYLTQWALEYGESRIIGPEDDDFSWTATLVPATATNRDKVPTSLAPGSLHSSDT